MARDDAQKIVPFSGPAVSSQDVIARMKEGKVHPADIARYAAQMKNGVASPSDFAFTTAGNLAVVA